MMKHLLAPHPLTLGLKYFLLMLLWQRCPRTTRFSGSVLDEPMPAQHMFGRILGGGMQYVTILALTESGPSSRIVPHKQLDKTINIMCLCPQVLSKFKPLEKALEDVTNSKMQIIWSVHIAPTLFSKIGWKG